MRFCRLMYNKGARMGKTAKTGLIIAILLGCGMCWGPSQAQADEDIEALKSQIKTMNQSIADMQQTIRQMQTVIDKYESQMAAPPPAPPAPSAPAPSGGETATLREDFENFKSSLEKFVKISGYYDFEWHNDDKGDSPNEFKQHHLSIFLDKRVEDWHFFTELEFEYAFDFAGTGGEVTGGGEAKIERAWLEYNHSDLFNVRAGKFLMPQYWTVNHYPSITVSTSRPLMVKRVIPWDTTGISAYGTHYYENDWGTSYNVFVGNGEAADRANNDGSDNKVFGGKLTAHIPLFDRFDLAGSTYIGENASDKNEWMWGAETQINIKDFELLAEVAHNTNEGQFGYYVQPGYHFLPKWTTFYRLDSRDDNNKIDDPDDAIRHIVGLRYQPIPEISLKGEIFRDLPDDETREVSNGISSSVVIFF